MARVGNVRLSVVGDKDLIKALKAMGDRVSADVSKAVEATALEVRGDIAKRINRGPATGIVYEKYSPRRSHQASAAGESPMTDTGRLASSITYRMESKMRATVGSQLIYARHLEFGTRTIAPRPAWQPAIDAAQPRFRQRLERALRKATK